MKLLILFVTWVAAEIASIIFLRFSSTLGSLEFDNT